MKRRCLRLARRIAFVMAALGLLGSLVTEGGAACDASQTLFVIERSKNANVVHYDVCLQANGDLAAQDPVFAYWVLENGTREDLNVIEQKYAYGVTALQNLGGNKVQFSVAGFEKTRITVEKVGETYRAVAPVKKKETILRKVYVKSKERFLQQPKILYVDVYGSTVRGNKPVKEHITPK